MLILLIVVGISFNSRIDQLTQVFIIKNFDPISFQIHLCAWLTKPVIFVMIVLLIKTFFQLFAARKCGMLMYYLSEEKKWVSRGFQRALIPILLKKAFLFSICHMVILIMLYTSQFVTSEFVNK